MKEIKEWSISDPDPKRRFSRSTKSGTARGKAATEAEPSVVRESPINDTSVMDTGGIVTHDGNPEYTTTATNIIPSLKEPTVWTLNPTGFVEQGFRRITEEDLASLSPAHANKLRQVAEARGDSIEIAVQDIARFLQEVEAPVIYSGTLRDAVEFYLDNQVV